MNAPPPDQPETDTAAESEVTVDPAAVRAARAGSLRIALLFLLPLGLMLITSIMVIAIVLARL